MALITCQECKKQVSDQAAACPHCGAPVVASPRGPEIAPGAPTAKKSSGIIKYGGGFLALCAALIAIGTIFSDGKPPPIAAAPALTPSPALPPPPTPEEVARKAREAAQLDQAMTGALYIKARLRNPDSLVWERIIATSDGSTVCYVYRAQNGYGGMNREAKVMVGTKISADTRNIKGHCKAEGFTDITDLVRTYLSALH